MAGTTAASVPPAGNGRALGIHAKSAVGLGGAKSAAAEVRRFIARANAGTVHDPALARRWALKRKVEQLFPDKVPKLRYGPDGELTVPAFRYRVAMCQRGTDGGPVDVNVSPDHTRAAFLGVQTCGSVWVCPCCAPKVARDRRDEMNRAIFGHVHAGGQVAFATFTMQHNVEQFGAGSLLPAMQAFAECLSRVKGLTAVRKLGERCGHIGTIRALEVTFGEMNGWHVHSHELKFTARGALVGDRDGRVVEWLSPLYRMRRPWARELIKRGIAGLTGNETPLQRRSKLRHLLRRCLTVQSGHYAAEYVAKFGKEPERERGQWGLASELTRSHMKGGDRDARVDGTPQRCAHASPWGLLNDALDGDERSATLFREFGQVFHGRRQLFWSRDLKKRLGIAELSDDELAARADRRCTERCVQLTPGVWRLVIAHNARWDVLREAALNGREGVLALIAALERRRPTHSGEFTESRSYFSPPGRGK